MKERRVINKERKVSELLKKANKNIVGDWDMFLLHSIWYLLSLRFSLCDISLEAPGGMLTPGEAHFVYLQVQPRYNGLRL